jgi:hypothetical protein
MSRKIRVLAGGASIALVASAECAALYSLYQKNEQPDFVRFGMSPLISFVLYFLSCQMIRPAKTASLLIALGLTFLFTWLGMVICVNTFGG